MNVFVQSISLASSMEVPADLQFVQSQPEERNQDIVWEWADSDKNDKKKNSNPAIHPQPALEDIFDFSQEFQPGVFFSNSQKKGSPEQDKILVEDVQDELLSFKYGRESEGDFGHAEIFDRAEVRKKKSEKETQDQELFFSAEGSGTIDNLENQYGVKEEEEVIQDTKRQQKSTKMRKKISRFVFKNGIFKGSEKISLPKKLGKLFVNYFSKFDSDDLEVNSFNECIKNQLKKNVKNDYTFEKTILRFLGQNRPNGVSMNPCLAKKISQLYRSSMSEIIKQTMKEEVIMKQKIERNRQIYMLQLKVYYLRCRSHRLAQKGSFK